MNTGDFVETCSVVVEHFDGKLEIVYWAALAGKSDAVSQDDEAEAQAEAKAA